ncbi:MAG: hypothetical protein HY907_13790 [Deltaproteobacteria bacterium]|nr:hypothetical protein [Deltaproteobacteria bacterium]
MRRAFGLLLVALGCGGGPHLAGDLDGRDGAVADDAGDVDSTADIGEVPADDVA